ncbi:response regulator transcription factor [Methylomicrobium lacus]|uniref:response regulator transcription factor n=1 Tax=Methylomicrobium lacus TaxID=136992 RepID=UPI00045E83F2|nr:response regulator [Methylomicrobium lacus]
MNNQPNVLLIDDDPSVRESLTLLMETIGFPIQTYESAEAFLKQYSPGKPGCLILDVNMPGMNGPELQVELARRKIQLPIIFLTGYGDIPMTVQTIKAGAVDFMIKPIKGRLLIERIRSIFQQDSLKRAEVNPNSPLCVRIYDLTPREREVMSMVVAGFTNKEIARQLSISHRTVEIHRARVMEKTGAGNLLELAQLCEQSKLPSDRAIPVVGGQKIQTGNINLDVKAIQR